jgi:beta-glucanase (GH16 family)
MSKAGRTRAVPDTGRRLNQRGAICALAVTALVAVGGVIGPPPEPSPTADASSTADAWVPSENPRPAAGLLTETTTTSSAQPASFSPGRNIPNPGIRPASALKFDDVTQIDTRERPSHAERSPARTGWNLVWADEFNGGTINREVWNVEHNSTFGDGNDELACLLDRPENIGVANGLLTITAREEATPIQCKTRDPRFPNGRSYTSGMLTTKNTADFQYGRFEINAKTPLAPGRSKGLWPAFWLRPSGGGIGEIDILEAKGTGKGAPFGVKDVLHTIHYDYEGTHPKQNTGYDLPSGTTSDGFHNYALEWEPGSIRWFVDGVQTYERNHSTTSWIDEAFANEFYILLNLAVGGNWPGSPTGDTDFPAQFQVDFVRVYQR